MFFLYHGLRWKEKNDNVASCTPPFYFGTGTISCIATQHILSRDLKNKISGTDWTTKPLLKNRIFFQCRKVVFTSFRPSDANIRH